MWVFCKPIRPSTPFHDPSLSEHIWVCLKTNFPSLVIPITKSECCNLASLGSFVKDIMRALWYHPNESLNGLLGAEFPRSNVVVVVTHICLPNFPFISNSKTSLGSIDASSNRGGASWSSLSSVFQNKRPGPGRTIISHFFFWALSCSSSWGCLLEGEISSSSSSSSLVFDFDLPFDHQNVYFQRKMMTTCIASVHLKPYYAHEEREDQKQNDAWGSHHVLVNQTCNLFARVPQFLEHLICDGFPMWKCLLPYLLPILT